MCLVAPYAKNKSQIGVQPLVSDLLCMTCKLREVCRITLCCHSAQRKQKGYPVLGGLIFVRLHAGCG